MKTSAPFYPLLFTSCLLFIQSFYLESWVARFMTFWLPKVQSRPRTLVKVFSRVLLAGGIFLLVAALLGRIGVI
jgi:hypothetical protein